MHAAAGDCYFSVPWKRRLPVAAGQLQLTSKPHSSAQPRLPCLACIAKALEAGAPALLTASINHLAPAADVTSCVCALRPPRVSPVSPCPEQDSRHYTAQRLISGFSLLYLNMLIATLLAGLAGQLR